MHVLPALMQILGRHRSARLNPKAPRNPRIVTLSSALSTNSARHSQYLALESSQAAYDIVSRYGLSSPRLRWRSVSPYAMT